MNIEVLLTETEIADELAESFEARDLPEKFFYWTPLSIHAWKALSARSEEALRETWEGLGAKAADLMRGFPGTIPVISFGAGERPSRSRDFMKALRAAGREVESTFPWTRAAGVA